MNELCKIAAEPYVAGSLENFHIVEHSAGHMVLKKLIANDASRKAEDKDCKYNCVGGVFCPVLSDM